MTDETFGLLEKNYLDVRQPHVVADLRGANANVNLKLNSLNLKTEDGGGDGEWEDKGEKKKNYQEEVVVS